MENKDYESAMPYLKRALEIDENYTNSFYGLGLCYYYLDKYQESFDICHKGLLNSVDRPENPDVRQELIKLLLSSAKEIVKQTNEINIWLGIKDELEAIDHTPIRFEEDKDINVLAKLEYAPLHAAKEHVVRYNPDKEYIGHLFVHELMHLKMDQQATINKRGKAVISTNSTLEEFNRRYLKYMQSVHKQIPLAELKKMMSQLSHGLGLQLMNCPLDLFVEHLIFTKYPVVRPMQLLSLMNMENDNINSVKRAASRNIFPKEIVRANKVMNMVSSLHFKEMYGINLLGQYQPTRGEYDQANDLYDEFKAYWDSYKPGDEYEMIEYFVQSLNMENLIEIVDEGEITSNMKTDLSFKSDLKDKGKEALSEKEVDVANAHFALNHQDGADPTETMMMSMYMLGAMEYFDTLEPRDVHRIALEIALVGVTGIHPNKKYTIKSLPDKEFGGYQLLAWYYVSWARAIPEKLEFIGLPFSKAYEAALKMYIAKNGK